MEAYSLKFSQSNQKTLSFGMGLLNQKDDEKTGTQTGAQAQKEETASILDRFEALKSQNAQLIGESKSNSSDSQIKNSCFNYLLWILFGKKIEDNIYDFSGGLSSGGSSSGSGTAQLTYTELQSYEENESTSFSTDGMVRTADGREISFQLDVEMSRSFIETTGISITQQIDLCDPLVINLDGNVADVKDQKFRFDIDGDGQIDEISQLGSNSGFLALDKNEDGIINDGTELFGTESGDGFSDLSAYDQDKNGWIDENDAIFDKLKVYVCDENGKEQLLNLKDAGVGAIGLKNSKTDFSLNQADNTVNARIRSTGIYLYENGTAGTIQQVDFAKTHTI